MATIYNMKTKSGIKYDVVFDYNDDDGNRKEHQNANSMIPEIRCSFVKHKLILVSIC